MAGRNRELKKAADAETRRLAELKRQRDRFRLGTPLYKHLDTQVQAIEAKRRGPT
jgi:hypothetical protein